MPEQIVIAGAPRGTPIACCRCCRMEITQGRCPLCAMCDGKHGPRRRQTIERAVRNGWLPPDQALAMCLLDDAWLAGRATIDRDGTFIIDRPVKPWEVVIAWGKHHRVQPSLEMLTQAALAPYMGLRGTSSVMRDLEADMSDALHAGEPTITEVRISSRSDGSLERDGIIIEIAATSGTIYGADMAPGVDIPAEVYSRPRGQA